MTKVEQHHDSSPLAALTIVSQTDTCLKTPELDHYKFVLKYHVNKKYICFFSLFYLPNSSTGKVHVLQSSIYWTTQQETESELIFDI